MKRFPIRTLPRRSAKFLGRQISRLSYNCLIMLPYFHFVKNTRGRPQARRLDIWFHQKVLGYNKQAYWPVHWTSIVSEPQNILVGCDSHPGGSPGSYIQGVGRIRIGDYCYFGPNIGIISANHDSTNLGTHIPGFVEMGDSCWIGMNAIILPNVILGDFTIVGAGSVVTKSFPEGHCVIAGNPAQKIKDLDKSACKKEHHSPEYVGYVRKADFEDFRSKYLSF